MDYKRAISVRHSCRSYLPDTIDSSIVKKLQASITDYNLLSGLNIQLILNNGDAFGNFSKSYGMFSGVNNYIAMIGRANGIHEKEKIGYYGEKLVLEATEYGLGTCWVAGTFDKTACSCILGPREEIYCVISIGYPAAKKSFKDKLINSVMHTKKKPVEDFFDTRGNVPDWFLEGIKAVQSAPSALNKQPVKFAYTDESSDALPSVRAWITSNSSGVEQIDLGIAKLHFELGASDVEWEWED
ncbi:nitroreductase family protein [Aminipila terrae]|uniref:Nitroreductase n=1 Tax=Aminipila terrae TaxID=2697030 RepID=A0A6P1MIX3_9FIRM|nr:nitroreductase family protein [Aminipila terrae]QHI71546.1 nitroreductase [Aminipila terrae]